MRKALWTLNIGHQYAPEITHFTYPFLMRYADKIGAEFCIISERQYPQNDTEYEKLQIHELGRDYDWNIYVDSDALIHPDFIDLTEHICKDTVLHNGKDLAPNRFRFDEYFRRDGRAIGSCNWFTVASNWCLDLWAHPGITEKEVIGRIFLTTNERTFGMNTAHLASDFILSRNIARYGLKFTTVPEVLKAMGHPNEEYLSHFYCMTHNKKVEYLIKQIYNWGLASEIGLPAAPTLPAIPDSNAAITIQNGILTYLTQAECHWLYEVAKDKKNIIEIGSYQGGSAWLLSQATQGKVTCVDVWDSGIPGRVEDGIFNTDEAKYSIFARNLHDEIASGKVIPIQGDSISASKTDKKFDMIWIDASHDYISVKADIEAWLPHLAPGGLLCGHDYSKEFPGVAAAVHATLPAYKVIEGTRIWAFTLAS